MQKFSENALTENEYQTHTSLYKLTSSTFRNSEFRVRHFVMRLVMAGGSNVKIWFDLELRFAVAARIDNIESSKIYYL